MPYLKLNTNVNIATEQTAPLLTRLSTLVAEQTGKPERYVMVACEGEQAMMFSGSNQPLAYIECKSIGLTAVQAKAISAALCQLLQELLHLPPDRVYIEFSNCPSEFWGWNASTFG